MDYSYQMQEPGTLSDLATALENDPAFQAYVDQVNRQKINQAAVQQGQPYGYWQSTPTGADGQQQQQFVQMPRPSPMGQMEDQSRTLSSLMSPLPADFGSLPPALQLQMMEARRPVYKNTVIDDTGAGGGYASSSQLDRNATAARAFQAQQAIDAYKQKQLEAQRKTPQGIMDEAFARATGSRMAEPKQESAYEKELAKQLAEAKGMQLRAVTPGTPEYERLAKEAKAAEAGQAREQSALDKADVMVSKAKDALSKVGFFTTGLPGQVLSNIGGTEARDLSKTVDTIKANIGFSELQKMRMESPTGGALGQVAVRELDFLQSALENLDTSQSQDQLATNLKSVITHYENFKKAKIAAQKQGGTAAPQQPRRGVEVPVKSAQDAEMLPPGTRFVLPDGRTGTKR